MKILHTAITLVALCLLSMSVSGSRELAIKMADSQLARQSPPMGLDSNGNPSWNYEHAVFARGLLLLSNGSSSSYYQSMRTATSHLISSTGELLNWDGMTAFALDHVRLGPQILTLYSDTHDDRWKFAAGHLREQLVAQPRTKEGGYIHMRDFKGQMWLDGAFMAVPFLAQYTAVFNATSTADWDEVVLQLRLPWQHLRIPSAGLLLHGFDETLKSAWADPTTGNSPEVWSRALGWYAMALVDTLDWLPRSHAGFDEIQSYVEQLAGAVVKAADKESGVWWIVMSYPDRAGNWRETSASAMFVYSLLKAARLGYLSHVDVSVSRIAAKKAWSYILEHWVTEGDDGLALEGTVEGLGLHEGNSGTFEYYIGKKPRRNDLRGIGPFIYAALEVGIDG